MRKIFQLCIMFLAMLAMSSCEDKKNDKIIIIRKPVEAKQTKPHLTGNTTKEQTVGWVGADYTVRISKKADTSLPLASDGESRYYDSRITLQILRPDGTEFFKRSFSKADFRKYVDDSYYKKGALLGIVFDRVEGNNMIFAASVGNPDKSSDEFVPLNITITNLGAVTIDKSTEQ